MEEKKRIRASGDDRISAALPHDLLVEEVMTRLPAKSLMRFKCVSKLWGLTIADPSFSKARSRYHTGGLFLVNTTVKDGLRFLCFLCATFPCDGQSAVIHKFSVPHREFEGAVMIINGRSVRNNSLQYYNGVTQVINGLFCLYSANRAALCNITTREVMELELPPSDLQIFTFYKCYLGYDSTSEEYKLLKVCTLLVIMGEENIYTANSEILTLGKDDSWRRLSAPKLKVREQCVYIDGAICWLRFPAGFIAFEIKRERFVEIPPPPGTSTTDHYYEHYCQYRGHLAVACSIDNEKLLLWELIMECEGGRDPVCEWIKHAIDVPHNLADFRGCTTMRGNLPTGELLMSDLDMENEPLCVSTYDHTTKKFGNFVIGNLQFTQDLIGRVREQSFQIYYYEEDITPLNKLISK